jgi:hypothetical protein
MKFKLSKFKKGDTVKTHEGEGVVQSIRYAEREYWYWIEGHAAAMREDELKLIAKAQ